jgi:tight adherence protein B
MNVQLLIPSIAVALVVICASVGVFLLVAGYLNNRVRERLHDVIAVDEGDDRVKSVILRDLNLSSVPFLNAIFSRARWARRLDNLLVQGDLPVRLGTFVALMLLLASLGLYVTGVLLHHALLAVPVGVLLALLPLVYANNRKQKRIRSFERQFPDALDMLTNALRAGMSLSVAIQVVSEESPDPVGKEFAILFEEHRLGLDMKDALHKLGERVDSAELHLFVTAVIMHRQTGGNLAEILEGTADVIRDRFRILGDVRSMTAQARLSGAILTILPLVIAGVVLIVAPDYLKGLVEDPIGRHLVFAAVVMQFIGFFSMRRIIRIKV